VYQLGCYFDVGVLDYNIFNEEENLFTFSPEAKKILEEFVKPCYTKRAIH